MGEEGVPFLLGGSTVFLAGPGGAAAGDERPVGLDCLGGVDGYPIVVSMFLCPQMTWAMWGGRPLMIASVTKTPGSFRTLCVRSCSCSHWPCASLKMPLVTWSVVRVVILSPDCDACRTDDGRLAGLMMPGS
jgi:hypothetical protein